MAVRFGILGAGGISRRFAGVLRETDRARLAAVAARDLSRAEAFAGEFGAQAAYGDYEALLRDPSVDAVYIGLTHNLHAQWCERALLAGKAVLCEKPMVTKGEDARRLCRLAKERGLLLMEAMWTRCMPAVRVATECVASGMIGRVRLVRASFCFDAPFDPQARLFNPQLAGGALMDAGVYPIEFAMGVLGERPQEVTGLCAVGPSGVDEVDALTLAFPSGALAELSCAVQFRTGTDAVILGTSGSIVVRDFLRSTQCEIYDAEGELVRNFYRDVEDGFFYEIEHFCDLMESGAVESPLIPHADTIACAGVFDALLGRWGLSHLQ
jgi:predicted dehydrogenase